MKRVPRSKLTVRKILKEGGALELHRLPFSKTLLVNHPDDVDLQTHMTAHAALELLSTEGYDSFLDSTIEELLHDEKMDGIRNIIKCAFFTGLGSAFVIACAISYIAVTKGTFPGWAEMALPLLTPAIIMWKQVGALEGDRLSNVAKVVKTVSSIPRTILSSDKPKEPME